MAVGYSKPKQSRSACQVLEAREREELFRHTCAVVLRLGPTWKHEGTAIIVVKDPALTRADVKAMFGAICEQYRVGGIGLRFREEDGEPLHAIFERRLPAVRPWYGARPPRSDRSRALT